MSAASQPDIGLSIPCCRDVAYRQFHGLLGKQKSPVDVAFGRIFRRRRKTSGLFQEALELEADPQRNFVSLIELARNQPTITTIFKLAPQPNSRRLLGQLTQKPFCFLGIM